MEETIIKETPEVVELGKLLRQREQELLDKFYEDNIDTIRNATAWKGKAEKDMMVRGALYQLVANLGNEDDDDNDRVNTIAESIIQFSQIFGYIYSPKTKNKNLPLILFPFQKRLIYELVESIEFGTDFMIEKSREMGVSWVVVYVFTWYWLFKPDTNFLMGSYKQDLVIQKGFDSMFGKIRYLLEGLPGWLMPKGFNFKKHFNQSIIMNPFNGSQITGDTMNPDFGRGARKTAIFFDELGMWDYAKGAWESCSETTNCRIGNSTPNGYDYFKQLIDSGLNKITLHWREHPFKDDLWYKYKKMTNTADAVAREIDISYDSSRVGVIYSDWKHKRVWGEYDYDPDLPLYVGWDFGAKDGTAIIWAQVFQGKLRIIDSYYKTGIRLPDYFAPLITGQVLTEYQYEYSEEELDMIREHSRWKPAVHFGDPAGRNISLGMDRSVIDTMAIYGIKINYNNSKIDHASRQGDAQRIIMRGVEMAVNNRNKWVDMSLLNYSFKATRTDGQIQIRRNATVNHDQYSHAATAFEYLCVGLMGLKPINEQRIYDKKTSSRNSSGIAPSRKRLR